MPEIFNPLGIMGIYRLRSAWATEVVLRRVVAGKMVHGKHKRWLSALTFNEF